MRQRCEEKEKCARRVTEARQDKEEDEVRGKGKEGGTGKGKVTI